MFYCVLILAFLCLRTCTCMDITATIILVECLKAGKLYRSVNTLERSHHLQLRLNAASLICMDYSKRSVFLFILQKLGCASELHTCMHFIMIVRIFGDPSMRVICIVFIL